MSSDIFVYVKNGCFSGSELLFVTKIETNKVKKECYLIRQDNKIFFKLDKNILFKSRTRQDKATEASQ